MKQIIIKEASLLSLPALHRLFRGAVESHFTYFSPGVQRRVIRQHSLPRLVLAAIDTRRILLLAKSGARIVGYAIGAAPATGPAQMYWLYVDPHYRGANIGLSLLSRMLKILGEKGADIVSIATHDHRRYYERQGFKFKHKTLVDGVKMDILLFKIRA